MNANGKELRVDTISNILCGVLAMGHNESAQLVLLWEFQCPFNINPIAHYIIFLFHWIGCCKEIKYVSFADSAKLCEAIPFKKLDTFPTLNDPEVFI